ncbi:MAG TPA: response regulator transcription factor [Chloroflexia bacterium]|nr:response regulator transcription factor [Chloroflexia bacterium]
MVSEIHTTLKPAKILIIEDEAPSLRMLKRNLTGYGLRVVTASDGQEALASIEEQLPDLILLDINLPRLSGLEVCRRVREWSQVPIIVLSARSEEYQKVEALELGADDYLTKPFGLNELVARIKVALRRSNQQQAEKKEPLLTIDDLTINFAEHRVYLHGQELKLTHQQYELLKYLTQNAGRVITHRSALMKVWGPEYENETQYLHVFIGQLRHKIEPDPSRPHYILTERGLGYRFRSIQPD